MDTVILNHESDFYQLLDGDDCINQQVAEMITNKNNIDAISIPTNRSGKEWITISITFSSGKHIRCRVDTSKLDQFLLLFKVKRELSRSSK